MSAFSEDWIIDTIPFLHSISNNKNSIPQQISLYERDCILLIDQNNSDNTHQIAETLKQIRFDKWCTGPKQRKKNKTKRSKHQTVFAKLLKPKSNLDNVINDNRYRSLQRYYSLKARLKNDRSIKVYRRERFYAQYPILLRQHNLLNETFIATDFNEKNTDYSQTNAEYILCEQKHYNELTRNDPHNIVLWCNFAKFYDDTVLLNRDSYNRNVKERKTNLLKQISIYEKAVEYNPNSTILLLHKLNLYQLKNTTNTDDDIHMLWQSIIEKNPHNTKLWQSYVYFELTQNKNNILQLDQDGITIVFEDAIRSLNNAKNKAYSSMKFHDGPHSKDLRSHIGSIERTLLNVFILYCKYEWFCGYKHKCVALLQAMIEFNIFKPKDNENICNNFERNLVYFKLFWESDCCRIGENACVGFNKFVELLIHSKQNESDKQSLLSLMNQREYSASKAFNEWMMHGCNKECNNDDDMDGVVLYDDIYPFLFEISDIELQQQLIMDALHVIGINQELIGKSPHILSNEIFNNTLYIDDWEQFMDSNHKDNNSWNEWMEFIGTDHKSSNNKDNKRFVLEFALNMIQAVHTHYSSEDNAQKRDYVPLLCSMILITNTLRGVSECKALCKSLLQNDQFNLRLYNIYAQIEVKYTQCSTYVQYKKVYKNAMKMLHMVPMEQKCYAPMLFFEYLMIEMLYKHNNDILQITQLMLNAAQFKFNVISAKKNKNKNKNISGLNEEDMNTAHSKYHTLLQQNDDSFWKSPDITLIKTECSLFNSRSPSAYFFIFGFILKLLTQQDIEDAMDYVLCQLIKKYKNKTRTAVTAHTYGYIGHKFGNKSEIEFILYYILRIIEWYKQMGCDDIYINYNQYILTVVKHCISLYPTNVYFLGCVEMYSSNKFVIRSMYKSLLINTRLLYASSLSVINIDSSPKLIVWIKYILFEIRNNVSVSCLLCIFNDCLLDPNCRYNVAFWRLYLSYLLYHNCKMNDLKASNTDLKNVENKNNLSRYQKQRLKRQKQMSLDERERSVNRLKNIFEMAIQTISNSKLLYLFGLDIINTYCSDDEIKTYLKFMCTKYLNFDESKFIV